MTMMMIMVAAVVARYCCCRRHTRATTVMFIIIIITVYIDDGPGVFVRLHFEAVLWDFSSFELCGRLCHNWFHALCNVVVL